MLFGVPETSFALPHSLTYSLARTGGPLSGASTGPTLWREQGAHSLARAGGPLSGASRGPTLWREQGARFYYWPNYVGGPINDVEMNCACCSCSGLSLSGVTFNYYSRHMARGLRRVSIIGVSCVIRRKHRGREIRLDHLSFGATFGPKIVILML